VTGAGDHQDRPPERGLQRIFSSVVVTLNGFGTIWIFVLMLIVNVDIFSRFLLNSPIQGVTEIVELSIVGIVFLQVSDAVRHGRLTRSDGLYLRFCARHPLAGHVAGLLFELLGAAFFVILLLGSTPRLVEAYRQGYFAGNEGLFIVPVWPIRLIVVTGCSVVAIQFLILAYRHCALIRLALDPGADR
jgi:TRAP-type mannitol/chloroaromatic compound transport system permease small subunit